MRLFGKYSEKELIDGCVKNSRKYQELLYRQYFDTMFIMCKKHINDESDALSVLNDGFLRVFIKIGTFSFKGSLEGWIRRIVYHSIADHFKLKGAKIQYLAIENQLSPVSENVLNDLYADDLYKILEELPHATKDVFTMFALDGKSHKEISLELGISINTSKWHISNAREILKRILNQQYPDAKFAG